MSSDNKRVVLIAAPPSHGKSFSLKAMAGDPGVAYLNTDLKDLPFKIPPNGMKQKLMNLQPDLAEDPNPNLPAEWLNTVEAIPSIHTVIIDTITHLMDQYENHIVLKSEDTRSAWQSYATFYKNFMHLAKTGTKNVIILAHTHSVFNEENGHWNSVVPVKGHIGRIGIEADYSIILSPKKVSINDLRPYMDGNDLLSISERENRLGFKYVFMTDITSNHLGDKTRSPDGMWEDQELYIDNDIRLVTDRLATYYA